MCKKPAVAEKICIVALTDDLLGELVIAINMQGVELHKIVTCKLSSAHSAAAHPGGSLGNVALFNKTENCQIPPDEKFPIKDTPKPKPGRS